MEKNKNFLVIKKENKKFAYGGNQAWFNKKSAQVGGCGVIAAVNAFWGLIWKDKEFAKKFGIEIGEDGSLPFDIYKKWMEFVYQKMGTIELPIYRDFYNKTGEKYQWQRWIRPSYGMSYIRYIYRSIAFAGERRVYLKCQKMATAYCSKKKTMQFIGKGLKKAGTVTVLVSGGGQKIEMVESGEVKSVKNHFYVITDLHKNKEGNWELEGSSWGQKFKISFEDWHKSYQTIFAKGSGMIYFIKAKDEEESRREALKSLFFILGNTLAVIRGLFCKKTS